MTHNVSRRTLAKGAAWAAPAVVATAAIPAYASSRTECPSDIATKMRDAFDSYVADVKAADCTKDLTGVTVRTWWRNTGGVNGAMQTMQHAVQIDGLSKCAKDVQVGGSWAAPIKLSYAVRNVRTSSAVNNIIARRPVGLGRGIYGNSNVMPKAWEPWGNWDVRNGSLIFNGDGHAVAEASVDNGFGEQRDWSGNTYTDSRAKIYSPTGSQLGNGLSIDETLTVPSAQYREWVTVPSDADSVLSGTPTVLQYTNLGDAGAAGQGTIYVAFGVKPLDVIDAPSYDVVAAKVLAVDPTVSDQCLANAYTAELANWQGRNDRFGGASFIYSGWGTGVITDLPHTGEYVWSNDTGAFEGSENHGRQMGEWGQGSDPLDFFESLLVGTIYGRDSTLGKQINFYDGIW